ncbi:hypothetical protein CBS101457_000942 [Exobasidium rhododendri]|nr:hypothetical protein CBS101457_000942 [Exobasidium rhododendri]
MPRVSHISLPSPPELGPLTEDSLAALRNLSNYKADPNSEPCPEAIPAYRRAAVLLGLFPGRNGELYVILSQRAAVLRSHGGDTAIPGGRFEASDIDLEATARREAWEETGLPIDTKRAPRLCELEPFLSANELLVTPIVTFLIDPLIKPKLNPKEVSQLFSVPLRAFLYHSPSEQLRTTLRLKADVDIQNSPRSEVREPSDWHTCRDITWFGQRIRRHTFWDNRNPIRGLTSDILIHAASIAYKQAPDYSLHTPNQIAQTGLIRMAFTGPLALKKRRVRPRMYGFEQPKDDNGEVGDDTSDSSRKLNLTETPKRKSHL